ncbi:PREDICTED: KRR1 [Prunus dulcis]|uniref:KRR-R motif-containing protein 1 n=1 Tax=Prunus dulcis TaxID=3755 RepID=A0A5E4EEL2_PRUDU|nr:PREDICTED: KRR1 [Prunus dulcis]
MVECAIERQLARPMFEGDSLVVVAAAVNNPGMYHSSLGNIYEDIKSFLMTLPEVSFHYASLLRPKRAPSDPRLIPEIVQILKKMFGPSLYEDENPEITSFLSRCPQGFEIDLQLVRWSRDPDISKMLYNRRFEPLLNEDGKPQGIAFSSYFIVGVAIFLQEAWPKVKSALKEYGIICRLDVVFGYITIKTTKTTDPDIIVKTKQLVHLLSIHIPVNQLAAAKAVRC